MSALTKTRNGLTRRRDPFSLFTRDLFGFDPFGDLRRARPAGFAPKFEVLETEAAYVIKADVPGVAEGDLDISLHDSVLTISGTRSAEQKKEEDTYYLYERSYGSFSRSFSLPEKANAEAVDAALNEGVLTVTIAKREETQPKKISVKK